MERKLIIPAKKKVYQPTIVERSTLNSPTTINIFQIFNTTINIEKLHENFFQIYNQIGESALHTIMNQTRQSLENRDFPPEDEEAILRGAELKVRKMEIKGMDKRKTKLIAKYGRKTLFTNPYLPLGWMYIKRERGDGDRETLFNHLNNETRFIDIFNYLDGCIDTRDLDSFPCTHKTKSGYEWACAMFRVNKDFYEEMSFKLSAEGRNLSVISIKKYIQAFCKLGILERLQLGGGKSGKDTLYKIGYWIPNPYEGIGYVMRRLLTKANPGINKLWEFTIV